MSREGEGGAKGEEEETDGGETKLEFEGRSRARPTYSKFHEFVHILKRTHLTFNDYMVLKRI